MISPTTAAALTHRLAEEQSSCRLPSLAAAVVRRSDVVWRDASGTVDGRADGTPADPDTQYRIGSITKTFVAVEIMRLRDAGMLRLTDVLDSHVPGTAAGGVTIAHLLSHGSGLQAETDGPWWERTPGIGWSELAAALSPASFRHEPGRRHHYSNVGYALLGQVIAALRGMPWHEAVRGGILDPLGMTRTTVRPAAPHAPGLAVHPFADVVLPEPEHDAGAMAPAGQLWSTVTDLARWAALLAGDTAGVIDPSTLTEMCAPVVVADIPGEPWTSAHGLGVQVWNDSGRRLAGHGGSMPGFQALLRVDMDTGDGVVAAANSTAWPGRGLGGDLLAILREQEPVPPAAWHADPGATARLDLTGAWFWGPAAVELQTTPDGGFTLGAPGSPARASRFVPAGHGTYTGLDGYYAGEPLRVVFDAEGRPGQLDLASFCFTRTPYDPAADVPGGVDPDGWR